MLTHFMSIVSFYTPWKHHNTRGFLMSSGGIKVISGMKWVEWLQVNPLSTNSTKWSNTLKQFVGNSQWIVWVCLTILWGWRLKATKTVTVYRKREARQSSKLFVTVVVMMLNALFAKTSKMCQKYSIHRVIKH